MLIFPICYIMNMSSCQAIMHIQQYFYACAIVYGMENVYNKLSMDELLIGSLILLFGFVLHPSLFSFLPSSLLSFPQSLIDLLSSAKFIDR